MPHITINDQTPRTVFAVGGAPTTGPFNFPFEFFAVSDLKVYIGGVLASYNAAPTLATEYSVTGTAVDGGFEGGFVTIGGNISNTTVVVLRDVPVARTEDFPYPSSTLDIKGLNTALDRAAAIQQQLETRLARTLRQPDADATDLAELPNAASRASKFMAFDAQGQAIVAAGTSANLAPVSGFINGLLDDADAATARGTLGAAPNTAQYLALAADGELTAERVFTPGTGLAASNAGANGAYIVFSEPAFFMRGYLAGLGLANNAGDAANDIDIAAGVCVSDNTPLRWMGLNAALTKRLDAGFVIGTGTGGLDTGAEANSTWYHLHLIGRHDLAITQRARNANVATLTFGAAHGLATGQTVLVRGVGSGAGTSYDGLFTVASAPTGTTITYANAGTNEGAVACAGLADGFDAIFSTSVAGPTMPGGWTSRRRLGAVRNDGARRAPGVPAIRRRFHVQDAAGARRGRDQPRHRARCCAP